MIILSVLDGKNLMRIEGRSSRKIQRKRFISGKVNEVEIYSDKII